MKTVHDAMKKIGEAARLAVETAKYNIANDHALVGSFSFSFYELGDFYSTYMRVLNSNENITFFNDFNVEQLRPEQTQEFEVWLYTFVENKTGGYPEDDIEEFKNFVRTASAILEIGENESI